MVSVRGFAGGRAALLAGVLATALLLAASGDSLAGRGGGGKAGGKGSPRGKGSPTRAQEGTGCAPTAAPGGEWRSYGHDYANTRVQEQEKTISPSNVSLLTPAWTFSTVKGGGEGDITGTPVVAYGCVYVATNDGWAFALNADTGERVWKAEVPKGGNVNSSVGVTRKRLYLAVNRAQGGLRGCPPEESGCLGPYVVSLDRRTGELAWVSRPIDRQPGSDVYGSPVVFKGVVLVGVSGGIAELSQQEGYRDNFQGSMSFLDARSGRILEKTWTIHPPGRPDDDFAGAGIWGTPAIDTRARVAYIGTANPYVPAAAHPHAGAVLKLDVDPRSRRFGEILAFGEGTPEEYLEAFSEMPCIDFPGNVPPYPTGLGSCADLDLDFGASPNLYTGPDGRKLVGAGQKSGVYHVFDARTMEPVWSTAVGPPGYFGGIVGSTAHDGESVYGPITIPGYVWSLSAADGAYRWVAPLGDGMHWGPPVAVANGVVYSVDFAGFLDAFEARSGATLLRRPLMLGGTHNERSLSWGGVSVARNTVYAAVGSSGLAEGYVVAFRPGEAGDAAADAAETLEAKLGGGGDGGEDDDGGGGGGGAPSTPVVAGPLAVSTNYATPAATTTRGGSLTFTNLDFVQHDVTADEQLPNGEPLFGTPLIGFGESAPVEGLDRVESGRNYGFFCSLHPWMRGQLAVR